MDQSRRRGGPQAKRGGSSVPSSPACGGVLFAAALVATVTLAGCETEVPTAPATLQLDELTFVGGVDVRESFPVQLGFRLVARNVADHDVGLVTDGCGIDVRAFRGPERRGEPAWSSDPDGPCLTSPVPIVVAAGDTVLWTRDLTAADVLGDSLPDGRYWFTVALGEASVVTSEHVKEVEVTAGDAELAVPR